MPCLLRDTFGQVFPVTAAITFGRGPTFQILLSDEQTSRLHATVWEDRGLLYRQNIHLLQKEKQPRWESPRVKAWCRRLLTWLVKIHQSLVQMKR